MVRRTLLVALLAAVAGCASAPPPHPGNYHASDADVTVTRLGHAGLLLSIGKAHFLVDPWLHETFFVHEGEPLGMRPSGFPVASAVLLTDDDALRVDATALGELGQAVPRAVGPPMLVPQLTAFGFDDVVALRPWEETTIDGVRITAVPARGNGYVLRSDEAAVYIAGEDADPAEATEIRRVAGPIDIAVLPAGGRRSFGFHAGTSPEQAAEAAALLGARRVIPNAYGAQGVFPFVTFTSDAVSRFQQAAAADGVEPGTVVVLESGESWHYYR